jgi:hypothetical protein
MRACWEDVEDRPSFAELEKQVQQRQCSLGGSGIVSRHSLRVILS